MLQILDKGYILFMDENEANIFKWQHGTNLLWREHAIKYVNTQ